MHPDAPGWTPETMQLRLDRFNRSPVRTSLLEVAGMFGARSVGLRPRGDVMGCIVSSIGLTTGPNTVGWTDYQHPFARYVEGIRSGYAGAIARMLTEAQQIGAHGVIEVRLQMKPLNNAAMEFLALGTAVDVAGAAPLPAPFATTLMGQDVSKLMQSGWTPAGITMSFGAGFIYRDYTLQAQTSPFAGNTEVTAYTRMVNTARAQARDELTEQAAARGADGVIVSDMKLRIVPIAEIADGAIASVEATFISRFAAAHHPPPAPLKILPLRDTRGTKENR